MSRSPGWQWISLVILLSHSRFLYAQDSFLKEQVDAALSLMTFTVTPDVTASNLSINSHASGPTELMLTQLGGGATMDDEVPIYLEGTLGFCRYDPKYVINEGGSLAPYQPSGIRSRHRGAWAGIFRLPRIGLFALWLMCRWAQSSVIYAPPIGILIASAVAQRVISSIMVDSMPMA